MLVLGVAAYTAMHKMAVDNLRTQMSGSARDAAQQISARFASLDATLKSLAANALIGNALVDDIGRDVYLKSFLEDLREIDGVPVTVALTNFAGYPYGQSERDALLSKPSWVARVVDAGVPAGDLVTHEGVDWVLLAEPVVFANTGRPEGAILLQFQLHRLLEVALERFGLDHEVVEPALALHYRIPGLGQARSAAVGNGNSSLIGLRQTIAVPESLSLLELAVEVFADPAQLARIDDELLGAFLGLGALAMLFVFLASRMLARSLTRRLHELGAATRGISLDNIGERRLMVSGDDEVCALAATFNTMLERLDTAYRELKNGEQQLKQTVTSLAHAQRGAESANRAKSDFLASMSHELRTPLNAILGYAHLLQRRCTGCPAQNDSVEIIIRSGEHLLGLINDILDVERIESGRVEVVEDVVDLELLLADVCNMIGVRASQRGLDLERQFALDDVRFIYTDAAKLKQIMINLLGNAVKYTERGRILLRVQCRRSDGEPRLIVEVEDTGRGIAAADLPRVFLKFSQIGVRDQEGAGLGLTITKSFVTSLGGEIEAQSREGEGSLFRVTLPVRIAADVESADVDQDDIGEVIGLELDGPPPRLLVVEDDPHNQRLLRMLLAQVGFQVRSVGDGEAALALFPQWLPNLIWMDIRMPEPDGVETARRMRALPGGRGCCIIAVSGDVLDPGALVKRTGVFDDFLAKPFRPEELWALLEKYLGCRFRRDQSIRESAPAPVPIEADSLPELLASLAPGWRTELRTATVEGRIERMDELVGQIRAEHPALAQHLSELIKGFEFERLLDEVPE